jgi:hypothetical protein
MFGGGCGPLLLIWIALGVGSGDGSGTMNPFWKLLILAVAVLSLSSCGLPAALGRSAGRLVNAADGLVGPALMAL